MHPNGVSIDSGTINTTNSSHGRVLISIEEIRTGSHSYGAGDTWNSPWIKKNFRFMMDIANLRGDMSFIVAPNAFYAVEPIISIARKMGIDISQFQTRIAQKIDKSGRDDTNTTDIYAPGIRVLICSANQPMIAYSTEPYVREELGYIGAHYCLQCNNESPIGGLAHEISNTERIFCHVGTCQEKFYGHT